MLPFLVVRLLAGLSFFPFILLCIEGVLLLENMLDTTLNLS